MLALAEIVAEPYGGISAATRNLWQQHFRSLGYNLGDEDRQAQYQRRARPYHVKQRMAHSNSPKIHVEHPGGGLVMNIHLSDVGPHAITLGHSGGVDASRMVQRQASHALQSYGHPQPFHAMPAQQIGPQGMSAWNAEGIKTLALMP